MGGIRTALYNYLFAKKNNGDFILRIEDTDQTRYVQGAESYIIDSLRWCGLSPDESPLNDGNYGPYRQSERKEMYRQFAEQLLKEGTAYYAFDTPEELEHMREMAKNAKMPNWQYNVITRSSMKNSLTLSEDETKKHLESGTPYAIRIKMPRNEDVRFYDEIRGWVVVNTSNMDDKVIFKGDGMPTYHLANVVDDYSMKISHVIRGEEWLPSAPLHVLLYKYLGWEEQMPKFAHLPLILKPDGNGKLSKRDGDRLGFPVFPLQWEDPSNQEISSGYREKGYFPDAFINMLAFLGWNPGTSHELFSMEDIINEF
jgi:glutamyl-tRNA synthetase